MQLGSNEPASQPASMQWSGAWYFDMLLQLCWVFVYQQAKAENLVDTFILLMPSASKTQQDLARVCELKVRGTHAGNGCCYGYISSSLSGHEAAACMSADWCGELLSTCINHWLPRERSGRQTVVNCVSMKQTVPMHVCAAPVFTKTGLH